MDIRRDITLTHTHRVRFTRHAFDPGNPTLADALTPTDSSVGPVRVLIFIDDQLLRLIDQASAYFAAQPDHELVVPPITLPGGEAAKNDWAHVEQIWRAIDESGLCRHSYIIAIGGGAILDLVGFAAATAHRGIRHVRMPTTTLSQGDGGVGVKNGVNYFNKKNWIGTFAIPHAVINDTELLRSLPEREKRAGLIEAVKVALIRDRSFYERIEMLGDALAELDHEAVVEVVKKSAEHHVDHIASGGDPFEYGSARPLDFGHWAAHKLEQLSQFSISHGEAVAIGMVIDLRYAVEVGLLEQPIAERVITLIQKLGFVIDTPEIQQRDSQGRLVVLKGFDEFREHLGGQLTITLVTDLGKKVEVHEMNVDAASRVIESL